MSTPTLRDRMLKCLQNRAGSKESTRLRLRDGNGDVITNATLGTISTIENAPDAAEAAGVKTVTPVGEISGADGVTLDASARKTFLPGEHARGIISDMLAIASGETADGETLGEGAPDTEADGKGKRRGRKPKAEVTPVPATEPAPASVTVG